MANDATGTAGDDSGSVGATGTAGDIGLDCAADESTGDAPTTSSSVPQASWEGREKEIAPMGSKGSIGAELDPE